MILLNLPSLQTKANYFIFFCCIVSFLWLSQHAALTTPKYHGGTLELTAKTPESFVKLGQIQIYVQLQKEKKKNQNNTSDHFICLEQI